MDGRNERSENEEKVSPDKFILSDYGSKRWPTSRNPPRGLSHAAAEGEGRRGPKGATAVPAVWGVKSSPRETSVSHG